jgi:protein-tyrosine-phosphatase
VLCYVSPLWTDRIPEAYLKRKVLFLCETNGLYSPIAEAFLGRIDSEHFEAVSAGNSCGLLHPLAVEVMKEVGIDLSGRIPRRVQELASDKFDYVIALDESTARAYRNWQRTETIHWRVDDPVAMSKEPEKQLRAFRLVRDQIAQRLRLFVIVHVRSQGSSVSATSSMAARAR